MSAIAGLMAGAQYFQAPDKPLYVNHIPTPPPPPCRCGSL